MIFRSRKYSLSVRRYEYPTTEEENSWRLNGKLHRRGEGPTLTMGGTRKWYVYGKVSRIHDLPAVIHKSGQREWFRNGKRHRGSNKPAIIYFDGHWAWYRKGMFIRDTWGN
jgi:hypothetical protein